MITVEQKEVEQIEGKGKGTYWGL